MKIIKIPIHVNEEDEEEEIKTYEFEVSKNIYAKRILKIIKEEDIEIIYNLRDIKNKENNYLILKYNNEIRCIYYDNEKEEEDPDLRVVIMTTDCFKKVLNKRVYRLLSEYWENPEIVEYYIDNKDKFEQKINVNANVIKDQICFDL